MKVRGGARKNAFAEVGERCVTSDPGFGCPPSLETCHCGRLDGVESGDGVPAIHGEAPFGGAHCTGPPF